MLTSVLPVAERLGSSMWSYVKRIVRARVSGSFGNRTQPHQPPPEHESGFLSETANVDSLGPSYEGGVCFRPFPEPASICPIKEANIAPQPQPASADPVHVDSKHYCVESENDHVRVLRARYGPHEKSVMHEQPALGAASLRARMPILLGFIVLFGFVRAIAAASETKLNVTLPLNWENSIPAKNSLQGQVFRYKGQPQFEVSLKENTSNPGIESLGLPFECDFLFGALQAMNTGKTAISQSRPAYFPDEFYSRVLLPRGQTGTELFACLYLGASNLMVEIRPTPTPQQGETIAPLLQAILDAAKHHSSLVYAPGRLQLALLKVGVPVLHGSWTSGRITVPNTGETDVLVRTGGLAEMKIMPTVKRGDCSLAMAPVSLGQIGGKLRTSPPYLSPKWNPATFEYRNTHLDDPTNRILIIACRQLTREKILLATIAYGSDDIPRGDEALIATVLDSVADSVLNGPKLDAALPTTGPRIGHST